MYLHAIFHAHDFHQLLSLPLQHH